MSYSRTPVATAVVAAVFFFLGSKAHAAPPVISSFVTDQATLQLGDSATLSWSVQNFDSLAVNGTDLDPGTTSLPVTPLVTTTYTLVATNVDGDTSASVTVTVENSPGVVGAEGRFVQVRKNFSANDNRFHLSELEVFEFDVTPDEADADGTSSNDLVQTLGATPLVPPTVTALQHGNLASTYDGDLEAGAEVYSTLISNPGDPIFMIDLGATYSIGLVRAFGRADNSASNRLSDFQIEVFADDGSGNPGALVNSAYNANAAPNANAGPVELDLSVDDPGITNFEIDQSIITPGAPITLSWQVSPAYTSVSLNEGIGDVTSFTNSNGAGNITLDPGPNDDTIYLLTVVTPNRTSYATDSISVSDQPLITSFSTDDYIVTPGTAVTLSWDVSNATSLTLNGADVIGSSSTTVTPTAGTIYTLTAANANGTISDALQIRAIADGEPVINEFLATNSSGLLDEDGEASDWIELHNPGTSAISLLGYHLTDDPLLLTKWTFPATSIPAGGYLVVFASGNDRAVAGSELHTNFGLASGGEYLALVKPDGSTIVMDYGSAFPEQQADISFGLGTSSDTYFGTPTPGAANTGGFLGFVADTSFSSDRGFYDAPVSVAVTSATPGAEIRYTLDGTKPTAGTGQVYTAPIVIAQTTVLRAAAFKPGFQPTNVDTHTYIFTSDVIANANMDTAITQDPTYGPQMDAALKAVPTVSLSFPGSADVRTEKEVSIEMINFEAGDEQLDAGLKRFGGHATDFEKLSVTISFRSAYGAGKLDFPVFDGHDYDTIEPADKFDSLHIRAGNHDMVARGAYMSNRFADDTMLDMGHVNPHGRFVHVYLNGIYWGQYHLRERWSAGMLSEYFGGAKDAYDAINANNAGQQFLTGEVYDGTGVQWQQARNLLAGADPFASARSHIDVANLIDFMLIWLSGNAESEFRAAGSPDLGVPFIFHMKDADGLLRNVRYDVTHNGPLNAMSTFFNEADPDYKILLADRIHKHFFNDGALTAAETISRLQTRVDEIQTSFIAESARWGFRTPQSWENYQDDLIANKFPTLANTMVSRFRNAGMYPDLVAPNFNQHGGAVLPGFDLAINAPAGTIYYTDDGTDPREAADPVVTDPPVTIVAGGSGKSAFVPNSPTNGFTDGSGNDWNEVGYDDSSWTSGTNGVGYEDGSGFESFIGIDTLAQMNDQRTACLIRIPFTPAAADLAGKSGMQLGVRYDDGFVAYLNGTEIARRNFAGTPTGDSSATDNHDDGAAIVFQPIDVSSHVGLLQSDTPNILAIIGLNRNAGSSDFLIDAELEVTASPSAGGTSGAISPTAIAYNGSFPRRLHHHHPLPRPQRHRRVVRAQRGHLLPGPRLHRHLRDHVCPRRPDARRDRRRLRRPRRLRVPRNPQHQQRHLRPHRPPLHRRHRLRLHRQRHHQPRPRWPRAHRREHRRLRVPLRHRPSRRRPVHRKAQQRRRDHRLLRHQRRARAHLHLRRRSPLADHPRRRRHLARPPQSHQPPRPQSRHQLDRQRSTRRQPRWRRSVRTRLQHLGRNAHHHRRHQRRR